jgi:RNA polymerase sigma-70 factor (ECF subfamily)
MRGRFRSHQRHADDPAEEFIHLDLLIQRWRAGDERAAEALYNRFHEGLFHLAYGLLSDASDAEEVAQDSLLYALSNITRFDPIRASFKTWLHIITVSRCRDRQRRRRLLSLPFTAWLQQKAEPIDAAHNPEQHALRAETRSQVWSAVQQLSPTLREAVILRYWAAHTYREIADITGCPLRTAQSRVRLAFERLRAALSPTALADLTEFEEAHAR